MFPADDNEKFRSNAMYVGISRISNKSELELLFNVQ